jgi:hypothetical protein
MLKMQSTALATLAIAGLVCAAGQANAQSEALTGEPVTLTVQNNFTLTRTTAMAFGTFAVVADTAGSNTATLTMDPTTGTLTPANTLPSQFVEVDSSSAARGVYDVTGAAPSTTMNVTISNLVDLTCGACSGTPPAIDLTSVTADDATPTTDNAGAATITLGAVLTTVAGGNQYTDGAYAGTFDITVAY